MMRRYECLKNAVRTPEHRRQVLRKGGTVLFVE